MPFFKQTNFALFIATCLFLSSCATIIGGSKYNAFVKVENKPSAKIYYKGILIGTGSGSLKILRRDANKVSFKVRQEGCPDQQFDFKTRSFRGWTFASSLLFFSFAITGVPIPIPFGIITDFATGAYFKPTKADPSITKSNYKNYSYLLDYNLCNNIQQNLIPHSIPTNSSKSAGNKEEKLIELKELFDSGMISEEEYKTSRKAILAQ